MTIIQLAVYCSSSDQIKKAFFDHADGLGALMARHDWGLVYGGGMVGLMGQVAKSVKHHSGKTIGVVPEALRIDGVVNTIDDELIITPDMHTRKAKMIDLADGFIGLSGGFGTLRADAVVDVVDGRGRAAGFPGTCLQARRQGGGLPQGRNPQSAVGTGTLRRRQHGNRWRDS